MIPGRNEGMKEKLREIQADNKDLLKKILDVMSKLAESEQL